MMTKYLDVLSVKEFMIVVLSLAEIQWRFWMLRFMLRFILSGGLDLGLTPLMLLLIFKYNLAFYYGPSRSWSTSELARTCSRWLNPWESYSRMVPYPLTISRLAAAESNRWLGERAGRSTLVVGTYLQLQLSVWSTEKPILVDPLALNNYDDLVSCCPSLSKFLSCNYGN